MESNKRRTEIWLVLPNVRAYPERFQEFVHIAQTFEHGHIVIVAEDEKFHIDLLYPIPQNVQIHWIGGGIFNKCKKLWQLAGMALQVDRVIIHDTFWSKLGIFITLRNLRKHKNIFKCLSLFFPNPDFFIKRRWRRYTHQRLPWRNCLLYLWLFLRRIPLEFISCRLSHGIIANSNEILSGVKKYYRVKNNLYAVPTSVDTEKYYPTAPIKKNGIFLHLLGVGSIQIRKGWHILIEAASQLKAHNIDVKIDIVSNMQEKDVQWFYDALEKFNMKNILTLSHNKNSHELRDYYCNADVLVHPAFSEGLPRTVKEAMACGCPVIASDLPGIQLLDPTNTWIMRFQPGNVEALKNCLIEFWNHREEWRKKRKEICQWITHSFTPSMISKNIISCYDKSNFH